MSQKSCCHGPGYATPLDAMRQGPRERLLYTVTVQPNLDEPHGDYLSTIDVDPNSATYCQIIHRTFTQRTAQELHHSGWNACSSCYYIDDDNTDNVPKRDKLILPALNSDSIYVLDVAKDARKPEIIKVIDGEVLRQHNVSAPHTTHCLANGQIMISTMGDAVGNAKADFILFDSNDFKCLGTWVKQGTRKAAFGYDFWYQPYFDVMVASEWGAPAKFRRGWNDKELNYYGTHLNFYKWSTQTLYQSIDIGEEGVTPLEIRFMHNPKRAEGFVGCALWSKVFYFKKKVDSDEFESKKVIDIPSKLIDMGNGQKPMPLGGLMSDIILSLDDKYLYVNNWFHGDVRQYDINDPEQPKLVGQIFLGGKIRSDLTEIKVLEDKELKARPAPRFVKGCLLEGGPQMMQLSLDGKRLYVSSSLYSKWDKQFYPEMVQKGGYIVQLDVDIVQGGLQLNEQFLVNFANEPYGPTLPHEMRYPGGDCTSDIWLARDASSK